MTEILRVENLTITYYSHSGSSQIGVKNIKMPRTKRGVCYISLNSWHLFYNFWFFCLDSTIANCYTLAVFRGLRIHV